MAILGVVLLAAVLGVALTCLLSSLRKGLTGSAIAVLILLLTASSTTALVIRLHEERRLASLPVPLGGALTITAPPGMTVYAGTWVFSGQANFQWELLFSDAAKTQGLVIPTDNPDSLPPETLGGPGATFAAGSPGQKNFSTMGLSGHQIQCGQRDVLLKRGDGTYDLIWLIEMRVTKPNGQRHAFWLPIRLRGPSGAVLSTGSASVSGGSTGGPRGDFVNIRLQMLLTAPSIPVPEEAKAKPLWEPGK
jgi:hypothetical protein